MNYLIIYFQEKNKTMKNLITKEELEIFKELFSDKHPHIYIQQVNDNLLIKFLSQNYIKNSTIEHQINYTWDYLLAQQLCDVQI